MPHREITVEDLEKVCRSADDCYFNHFDDERAEIAIDGYFSRDALLTGLNAFVRAAYEDGRKRGLAEMDGAHIRLGASYGVGHDSGTIMEAEARIKDLRNESRL